MIPQFHPAAPLLNFKLGRKVEQAQGWYVDGSTVYVNWGGEPKAVKLLAEIPAKERVQLLVEAACSTLKPNTEAHWVLAQEGLLRIASGRFGLYCELTEVGKRRHATPEATAGSAKAETSCEAATPRSRRKVAKQAVPDNAPVANTPPATPLQAGASSPPGRARRPAARTLPPTPAKRAVQRAPGPLQKPNAVRVTLGTRVTYYPVSMFGALHGEKIRVITKNKLYRSCSLEASTADVEVRP